MTTVTAPALAPPGRLIRTLPRYLAVAFQLALILLAVHLFRIEPNRPFFPVLCLASGGFLLHAWLPRRFRPAFFSLVSMAGVLLLLGWAAGGWALAIGGGLLALCHLPVPMKYRLVLVAGAGVGLVLWRTDSQAPFWPVLGSMFMFRLIVYLYDLRHQRRRPPLFLSLAYFFPLPNVCFTLFPVLDFKTFRETYYDDEPYTVYQTGVAWIVRGLTHLLAYRFVKYYLLPAPHELRDLPYLLLFLATNYALYLRVSGWFHLATGVLHLFGFNLPRTHHNYFLASSVSDIWRRINIYWKDFMTKVFFYPAFFRLRGRGTRAALFCAGLWVFLVTWLLHSYQVFWLRGELPLAWRDAALWLTAGVVVAVSLQLDLRRAAAPSAPGGGALGQEALGATVHVLKVAGTFLLVSFFWACWTLPKFPSVLYVLATSGAITAAGVGTVLAWGAAVVAAGVLVRLVWLRLSRRRGPSLETSFPLSATVHAVVLLVLIAAALPQVGAALGPRVGEVLATLRLESTTPVEAAVVVQGYYEEIADTPVQAAPLLGWSGRPEQKRPGAEYTEFTRPVDDLEGRELIPGWRGQVAGRPFTVNRLGLRDRDSVTRAKPAGGCRIAVVGSSVVMGWGVGDGETFPRLLETGLNAGRPRGAGRVEVLNFGTGNSHAIHRRVLLERKVFAFDPDAVFYVAHQDEYLGPVRHLARLVAGGTALPYPYLREVVRQAGVGPETPQGETEARLQPFAPEILRGVYADIVAQCRKRGVLPVWVYVPMPGVVDVSVRTAELVGLAEESGFVVVNLADWADGHEPGEVKADRHHANALGHRLIAERLRAALRRRPDALPACARP